MQAGERASEEPGNALRLKDHQSDGGTGRLRRARGLRVGHVAGYDFRPLAFGAQGRATEFEHAKQVHDVLPPPVMAVVKPVELGFQKLHRDLKAQLVLRQQASDSRSTETLLPSGRSSSPRIWCATGRKRWPGEGRSSRPWLARFRPRTGEGREFGIPEYRCWRGSRAIT